MEKVENFEISFVNKSGIFYPDNTVDGYVSIQLTAPVQIKRIVLKVKGKAKVEMLRHSLVYFRGGMGDAVEETYFKERGILHGSKDNNPCVETLSAGLHHFPFRFQLPSGLPSSYEDSVGRIRYYVKCKIDLPGDKDKEKTRLFTIISDLDLNANPVNMEPLNKMGQKQVQAWFSDFGLLTAQFHIDHQGFVPGERIKPFVSISNESRLPIAKYYVDLRMVIKYCTRNGHVTHIRKVAESARPCITASREGRVSGEELVVVPPIPPSFLIGCSIIDISYQLHLIVNPIKCSSENLELFLPVVIGTVPLLSVVAQATPTSPPSPTKPISPQSWIASTKPSAPAPPIGPQSLIASIKPSAPAPPISPPSHSTPVSPLHPPCSFRRSITGPVRVNEGPKRTRYAPFYVYYECWGHESGPRYQLASEEHRCPCN